MALAMKRRIRTFLSSDDRGTQRLRRAAATSAVSLVARFGNLLVLLVTVPLANEHLGPERFGMWMMLSSIGALMTFADFGIGNGVLTLVASSTGSDDAGETRRVIASGFSAQLVIGALLGLFAATSPMFVDWAAAFNLSDPLGRSEAAPAAMAFFAMLACAVPLALASKTQMGLQQGYQANAWLGLGSFISLAGVIAAIHLDAGVPWMVLALFGGPQLAMLLNFTTFFLFQRRDLWPRLSELDPAMVRTILRLGGGFFLLQAIAAVTYRLDALIVAHSFSPVVAGHYAVYERLFSVSTMLLTITLAPFWPAYSEAIRRGDHAWIRRTLMWTLGLAVGSVLVVSLAIALLSDTIVTAWLGHAVPVTGALLVGFVVWKCIEALAVPTTVYLNGAHIVRPQVICSIIMGIVALTLKLVLVGQLGLWSVIWITIVCYVLFTAIPLGIIMFKNLRPTR